MKNKLSALHLAAAIMVAGNRFAKPQFALDYETVGSSDPLDINAPGTELDIYFCPRVDFTTLQDAPATPTALDEIGVIQTAHTFPTGNGFYKLRVMLDQNSVQNEPTGNTSGAGWKNSVKFTVQGNKEELSGIAAQLNNDDAIFIVPLKDGTRAQIGSKSCRAYCKPMFDSKTDSSGDARGWMFEVTCYDKHPLRYKSDLTLTLHS